MDNKTFHLKLVKLTMFFIAAITASIAGCNITTTAIDCHTRTSAYNNELTVAQAKANEAAALRDRAMFEHMRKE